MQMEIKLLNIKLKDLLVIVLKIGSTQDFMLSHIKPKLIGKLIVALLNLEKLPRINANMKNLMEKNHLVVSSLNGGMCLS